MPINWILGHKPQHETVSRYPEFGGTLNDYYYFKIVSHRFNVSEDSYLSSHLAFDDKLPFFAFLWLVFFGTNNMA